MSISSVPQNASNRETTPSTQEDKTSIPKAGRNQHNIAPSSEKERQDSKPPIDTSMLDLPKKNRHHVSQLLAPSHPQPHHQNHVIVPDPKQPTLTQEQATASKIAGDVRVPTRRILRLDERGDGKRIADVLARWRHVLGNILALRGMVSTKKKRCERAMKRKLRRTRRLSTI
jgi:hypothetical protein